MTPPRRRPTDNDARPRPAERSTKGPRLRAAQAAATKPLRFLERFKQNATGRQQERVADLREHGPGLRRGRRVNARRHDGKAVELHGKLRQSDRDKHLLAFKAGKTPVLCATDMAGRGLHVSPQGRGQLGLPAAQRSATTERRERPRRSAARPPGPVAVHAELRAAGARARGAAGEGPVPGRRPAAPRVRGQTRGAGRGARRHQRRRWRRRRKARTCSSRR